ncbi:MAG: tetrahydromethanopterin synthesis protein, partial [Mehylophilales bacterium 35-46-6]
MIFETIISTINTDGDAHVTPFGIRMQDGLVVISPYKPSTTLQNILATGHAVLNLTDDVRVFAG